LVVVLLALAAGLAGCGGSDSDASAASDSETLSPTTGVSLDGRVGPANAAIGIAERRGYFEDVGLDVWSGSPGGPARTTFYVASGIDTFGVTQLPQLVLAQEKGMPLVAIGSLVPRSTASMIWLQKSKVQDIVDLKGRTIAIPGIAFQEPMLESVLEPAGLTLADVEVKPVGYGLMAALLSGRADAIFGGSANVEGAALEADGADLVVRPVQSLGVPAYDELVVIARRELVEAEPQLARDFMAAVRRGIEVEVRDPSAAVKLIEESPESSPEASPKGTEAGVTATLPLLSETGLVEPEQAEALMEWMQEEKMIKRTLPVSALIANP
jgi:putative hydroxymethylpyrimidine transport system substrate-binding protein